MALLLYWKSLNLRLSTEIITRYENVVLFGFNSFGLFWALLACHGPWTKLSWFINSYSKKKKKKKKEREELIESSGFSTIRLIIDFCVSE